MRFTRHVLSLFRPAAVVAAAILCLPAAAKDPAAARPVVLELFTSQGCSSCPPADRLLSELGERDEVIALAFHVDYWNHLGWRDPFSRHAWSERQERYADALYRGRVYTPQLVVDGRTHLVGSRRAEVEKALLRSAAEPPAAALDLSVDGKTVTVTTDLRRQVPGELGLLLARLESGRETRVERGENARRTLHDDYIVLELRTLASVAGDQRGSSLTRVELPAAWTRPGTILVALLQHPESRHILGGAKLSVTE